MNTLNSFSFKTQIVVFFLNFQHQNSFKIQYLPHFKYEKYEINFIKFLFNDYFPTTSNTPLDSNKILIHDSINVYLKNGSIVNILFIVTPKVLNPSQCTLAHCLGFQIYQ
jgi:hypothetical protein